VLLVGFGSSTKQLSFLVLFEAVGWNQKKPKHHGERNISIGLVQTYRKKKRRH
jgi:hypothetical protein